jgi:hypothetical protein
MRVRKIAIYIFVAAMALGASACSRQHDPVPNVVGERLDVAKINVAEAGYTPNVLGGGVFGVVVDANWTVCEQRPAPGTASADEIQLIVDRACEKAG